MAVPLLATIATFTGGTCLFTKTCSHLSTAVEHFSKNVENVGESTLALSRALNTTGHFVEKHVTDGVDALEFIPVGKIIVGIAATILILQTIDTTTKNMLSIYKSYQEFKKASAIPNEKFSRGELLKSLDPTPIINEKSLDPTPIING